MGKSKVVVRQVIPHRGHRTAEDQGQQVINMEVGNACEEDRFVDEESHQAHCFEDKKTSATSAAATIAPCDPRIERERDEDGQLNRDTGCKPQVQVHMVVEDHGAHKGGNQPKPTHQQECREASPMVAEKLLGLAERWATSFQKSVQGPERLSEVMGNSDLTGVAPG